MPVKEIQIVLTIPILPRTGLTAVTYLAEGLTI